MKKLILSFYFMVRLNLANHYAVTVQIDDRLAAFETENQVLIQARAALHAARQEEDRIYHSYSAKDFTATDLKAEKNTLCKYMSTVSQSMRALLHLPDEQAETRREGEIAVQKFADFNYSSSNGYAAIASKVINMKQEWQSQQEVLTTLGIWPWIVLAAQKATIVLDLIEQRVDHEADKETGAMIAAREATDEAIKNIYEVINSLNVVTPSDELTYLTERLYAIGERAMQYYVPSASTGDEPEPDPEPTPEPDPEPEPEPEPTPEPEPDSEDVG